MCSTEIEQYYAVYYTHPTTYFIGRVVKLSCTCNAYQIKHIQMKFLSQNLIGNTFDWARTKQKLECVDEHFVFYGPLTLKGSGPFQIEGLGKLNKKFKELKKAYK